MTHHLLIANPLLWSLLLQAYILALLVTSRTGWSFVS